ncbi:hypothetical protein LIA77_04540 [Sarocladium implicatum]|nr:hypothetical protein LIA77_04540 [Sarocladium implicatum]
MMQFRDNARQDNPNGPPHTDTFSLCSSSRCLIIATFNDRSSHYPASLVGMTHIPSISFFPGSSPLFASSPCPSKTQAETLCIPIRPCLFRHTASCTTLLSSTLVPCHLPVTCPSTLILRLLWTSPSLSSPTTHLSQLNSISCFPPGSILSQAQPPSTYRCNPRTEFAGLLLVVGAGCSEPTSNHRSSAFGGSVASRQSIAPSRHHPVTPPSPSLSHTPPLPWCGGEHISPPSTFIVSTCCLVLHKTAQPRAHTISSSLTTHRLPHLASTSALYRLRTRQPGLFNSPSHLHPGPSRQPTFRLITESRRLPKRPSGPTLFRALSR